MTTQKTILTLRNEFADLLRPYISNDDIDEVLAALENLIQPHVSPLAADQLRLLAAPFLELRQLHRRPRSDPRVGFRGMLKKLGYDWQQLLHCAGLVEEAETVTKLQDINRKLPELLQGRKDCEKAETVIELQDINRKLPELLQDQKVCEKLASRYSDMKISKRLSREIKELNARRDEIFKLYPELAETKLMSDEGSYAARLS